MKRFCYLLLLSASAMFSQVGIGTVTPNAVLEIKSSNEATPSNTDGLLIPKIEEFPATAPTSAQDGMLVYVTGAGTEAKGFYAWDHGSTSWVLFGGARQIDDLIDGISDNDGTNNGSSIFFGINAGINDDGTDNRNVGVGFNSLANTTSGIANVALGYWASRDNTIGYGNVALGDYTLRNNTEGYWSVAIGPGSLREQTLGNTNIAIGKSAGDNITIGTNNIFIGQETTLLPNSNNRLMIENLETSPGPSTALIYGEFDNDILRTNATLQIGNPSGTGYAFPSSDGSTNQILQTDGAGAITWVNPSTTGAEKIDDLADGRSDNDGSEDGSSIFIGVDSGISDDNDDNKNVGLGYRTLATSTNGYENTAIGWNALTNSNTLNSTAVGSRALQTNTSGSNNSAFGKSAMRDNTIGFSNAAVGSYALGYNISGYQNTSIGYYSLGKNTSGENNTALGSGAGEEVISGINNTFIGAYAGGDATATAISGSIFLGHSAGNSETNDNRLYIENSNSTTPLIYGEFDTDILGFNGDVAIGHQAPLSPLHIINEGTSGVQNIVATIGSNTSNRPVLQFSETATANLTDGMSLEYDGRGTGDANRMVINNIGGSPLFEFRNGGSLTLTGGSLYVNHPSGSGSEGLILRNTVDTDVWRMYQQWNSNTLALFFNNVNVGNFDDASGAYTAVSDRNLKKNISPTARVLDKIAQLEVVDYNFKLQKDNKKYTGLIAQEVEKVFPHLVVVPNEESESYTMDYSGFGVLAIKAIQEQQSQIELLKQELAALKAFIQSNE